MLLTNTTHSHDTEAYPESSGSSLNPSAPLMLLLPACRCCIGTPQLLFFFSSKSSTVAVCYKHNWKHLEQMGLSFQTKHKPHTFYYSTKFLHLHLQHAPALTPFPEHQHMHVCNHTHTACSLCPMPVSSTASPYKLWQHQPEYMTAESKVTLWERGRERGKRRLGVVSGACNYSADPTFLPTPTTGTPPPPA